MRQFKSASEALNALREGSIKGFEIVSCFEGTQRGPVVRVRQWGRNTSTGRHGVQYKQVNSMGLEGSGIYANLDGCPALDEIHASIAHIFDKRHKGFGFIIREISEKPAVAAVA